MGGVVSSIFGGKPKQDKAAAARAEELNNKTYELQKTQADEAKARNDKADSQLAARRKAIRGRTGGRSQLLTGGELGVTDNAVAAGKSATLG